MENLQELSRIGDLVRRSSERFPDNTAIEDGGLAWSYRTLLRIIHETQKQLITLGVKSGDRVLVVAENCAEMVAILIATSELDAWTVLVSARLAPEEINRILEHCTPRTALFLSRRSEPAAAHAKRLSAHQLDFGELGPVDVWQPETEPLAETMPDHSLDRTAAMIYTSGSTGVPKGAMLTHKNLIFMGLTQTRVRRYSENEKIYCVVPIAHIGGLCSVLMGMLACGGCINLHQRFSPEVLGQVLRESGITILAGVPTLFVKFLEWIRAHPDQFAAPELRLVTSASSPLDPAVKADIEAAFGLPLMNGYGSTETSAVICQTEVNQQRHDVSVGKPLPDVEIRFIGDNDKDVAQGEVGEIIVLGPNVFPGYYHNGEATAAAFTKDGWFKTGDLGYCDKNGDVFITGRSKDTIKRSGYNIYPIDVEMALNAHPLIAISAVVGRPRNADEEVVAFIQLIENATLTEKEIIAFLKERLAAYKLPNVLQIVPQLPTLHNGKVDKVTIRRLAMDEID